MDFATAFVFKIIKKMNQMKLEMEKYKFAIFENYFQEIAILLLFGNKKTDQITIK